MTWERRWYQWRFSRTEQRAFLQDLVALVADGVSVSQAVDTMQNLYQGSAQRAAQSIALSIAEGHMLAEGMQGWFSHECVDLMRVAEQSGTLLATLRCSLDVVYEKNNALRHLLMMLLYPLMVVVLAMVVLVFVKQSVLQTFLQMQPLAYWPALGKNMYGLALFVEQCWWLVMILIGLISYLVYDALRRYTGRLRVRLDQWPVWRLYRRLLAARFLQHVGLLLQNGLGLQQILTIMEKDSLPYLRWHLQRMYRRLGDGKENIAEVLSTGLLDEQDQLRLQVVAASKGFGGALTSLSQQLHANNLAAIQRLARFMVALLLGGSALLAALIVLTIYSVGGVAAGL